MIQSSSTFDLTQPALKDNNMPIPVKYLQQAGATTGQVIKFNGTDVVWGNESVTPGEIDLTNAHILVGNASNIAADVALTGDVSITNAGVSTVEAIQGNPVTAGTPSVGDVYSWNGSAFVTGAVTVSPLTSAHIFVGNVSNAATDVAVSGDVTMSNAGVTGVIAIQSVVPKSVNVFDSQLTTTGGSPTEALTITGVAASDHAFVQVVNDGTNNVTVLQAVCTLNTVTITFSGDPSNDTVVNILVTRATGL